MSPGDWCLVLPSVRQHGNIAPAVKNNIKDNDLV
jgi:hypothetical protein